MQVRVALDKAIEILTDSDSASLDARVLLCFVLNKPASFLYTWPDYALTDEVERQFFELVKRRAEGVPVAYLTGQREFWTLSLRTRETTLIPRPETETLVEAALARLKPEPARVCDLGTGTGAIALAIAKERTDCEVLGVDRIEDAVLLARENAQLNRIHNATFRQSDWFETVDGKFDMIVSNPPYVERDSEYLNLGDVRFEPLSALTSGKEGLDDIRVLAAQAPGFLVKGGWLLLEHGYQQGLAVRDILHQNGFDGVTTLCDLQHNERVTVGHL